MPVGTSVVPERWLARRDRLLASPRFQRWATAFPLTRWIARQRARELFDLCAGFVYSQVLAACVQVRLFDHIADGPVTPAQLASRVPLAPEALQQLLEAATALRLVERRAAGRYGLGVLGAALLGNPGVVAMVRHHRLLYDDLRDPLAPWRAGRGGVLPRYWAYAEPGCTGAVDDARIADYTALMSASQPLVAGEILDAYSLRRRRTLLDLGGGDGTFAEAVAARYPALRVTVFDLPPVAARAQARFAAAGVQDRATAVGGDFRADLLPAGFEAVSLVRVVHDHDDGAVLRLLRAVRGALLPGGVLLIGEPMAGARGAGGVEAYFHVYLRAMGQGRPRTADELASLLTRAGFVRVRRVPTRTPLLTGLIVAEKAVTDSEVGKSVNTA